MSISKLFACCSKKSNSNDTDKQSVNGNLTDANVERVLRANDRNFNEQFKYADNFIRTSKYSFVTFFPLNVFEQFQRLANFYFLVLMLLQFIPWISSIAWYSTAIPLFFVLTFSAAKDAYDDIQRHRSDNQVNNRISYVVRNGQLVEEKWMDVKVGDVIRMENHQFVAADLLLLSTSEPHGLCYIETAELDGETNLKARQALPETYSMGDKLLQISQFKGEIHCEAPNNKLNQFEGRLSFDGDAFPLDNEKMLLRGCILRNTRWCYGVVVFAGRDTKLMMNSGKTKYKRTSLDRFLNILIMGIVLFLIAMCLICTILCGLWEWTMGRYFTIYLNWDQSIIPKIEKKSSEQIAIISFFMFFSYLILLNTVVPISLYVSVEILRFVHSMWINCDKEMYYAKGDIAARARTTTLNEELGQVQYIFSDKTGTLTQNVMAFRKCSINGQCYGDIRTESGEIIEITENTKSVDFSSNPWYESSFMFYDPELLKSTKDGIPEITEFWRLLALCHTIMPDRKNGKLEYQAQSPDEAALTTAARNFGYVFKSRTANTITLDVNEIEENYDLLAILDFNNVRKRMSVIVRNFAGEIILYCKGADTIILERISSKNSELLKASTMQHLDEFATDGLRTLCLAYKKIDSEYFKDWNRRQKEAALQLVDRQEKLDELYEEIEHDMTLLGATAIEDKLQDGVPDTIAELAQANIKIWVLTGDKQETAINIGYSCKLLTEDLREVFVIDGETEREVEIQLKGIRRRIEQALGPHSLLRTSAVMRYIDQIIAKVEEIEENARMQTDRYEMSITQITPRMATEKAEEDALLDEEKSGKKKSYTNAAYVDSTNQLAASDAMTFTEKNYEGLEGYALVINGHSLTHALKQNLERTLLDIGCLCKAVVCCRVTPLQKAMVVDLVKRNKKAVTLAVGDGANDVSMIKTAHIGVGISGQEGMQAVLASDYSIGQFRFLQRLLLVHGRWSYLRMAKFLRYFFYKNFAFTLTNFWYSFFCGYSAQTVYDPVFIAFYNLFFTALPVLAMGVFDQDLNDQYSMKYAKLYMPGQYNLFFNMRIFIYSVLHGMISSLIIFFVPYGAMCRSVDESGRDMNDYPLLAFTCFTALIIVVTGQIMFDTSYWTAFNHIVIWGSLILYFAIGFILYEGLPMNLMSKSQSSQSVGVFDRALTSLQFWLCLAMITVILLLPVLVNRFFWLDTHPSYADRLRLEAKQPVAFRAEVPEAEKPRTKVIPRPIATKRRGSFRSGYAFSHQQGFGDLITKGKLFKQVEQFVNPSSQEPSSHTIKRLAERSVEASLSPVSCHLMSEENKYLQNKKSISDDSTNNERWNAIEETSSNSAENNSLRYRHIITINEDQTAAQASQSVDEQIQKLPIPSDESEEESNQSPETIGRLGRRRSSAHRQGVAVEHYITTKNNANYPNIPEDKSSRHQKNRDQLIYTNGANNVKVLHNSPSSETKL